MKLLEPVEAARKRARKAVLAAYAAAKQAAEGNAELLPVLGLLQFCGVGVRRMPDVSLLNRCMHAAALAGWLGPADVRYHCCPAPAALDSHITPALPCPAPAITWPSCSASRP